VKIEQEPVGVLYAKFNTTPLPGSYFLFLIGATGTYLMLVELAKRRLMKRVAGLEPLRVKRNKREEATGGESGLCKKPSGQKPPC
jgi:hypothetical protein